MKVINFSLVSCMSTKNTTSLKVMPENEVDIFIKENKKLNPKIIFTKPFIFVTDIEIDRFDPPEGFSFLGNEIIDNINYNIFGLK